MGAIVTPLTATQLASWARKAREATTRRDELIRQLHTEGVSLRKIGEVAGMTHAGVRRVLLRG